MMAEVFTPEMFESLDARLDMVIADLIWWSNALKAARDAS
jgi:hypothetical protein